VIHLPIAITEQVSCSGNLLILLITLEKFIIGLSRYNDIIAALSPNREIGSSFTTMSRFNDVILLSPYHIVKSRFHCIEIINN